MLQEYKVCAGFGFQGSSCIDLSIGFLVRHQGASGKEQSRSSQQFRRAKQHTSVIKGG